MTLITYWAFIGTLYLIILTYQDFKNNMNVDDRFNWFMLGVTFSLTSLNMRSLWFILATIAVVIILHIVFSKYKVLGEADIKSLTWIIYGCAILNYTWLLWYALIFIVLNLVYNGIKLLFKYNKPTPYYSVLLGSFIILCFLFNLYSAK